MTSYAGINAQFGNHIVFVDESGDHGLKNPDPQYPVFVLLFVIIAKQDYVNSICPAVRNFKFHFWGHDEVILHEHDIRKGTGPFQILSDSSVRNSFFDAMNEMMSALPVTLVAVIIDKVKYAQRYHQPVDPYDYALEAGLERVCQHLRGLGEHEERTSVVVECRGRREDEELELAFRRICDGSNALRSNRQMPFDLEMIPKTANSIGLQLADLMARPIGVHYLKPEQRNRAFEIVEPRFRRSPAGQINGWGLKVLP